jgi:hypothetical protein
LRKRHIHHITPRSQGGGDNPENLASIDFVEHAKLHAEEFIRGGIQFDFRHEGWPFLEEELRLACREERSRRMKLCQNGEDNPMFGVSRPDRREAWVGDNNPMRNPDNIEKLRERVTGEGNPMFGKTKEKNPFFGKHHTEETCQRLSELQTENPSKGMEGKTHTESSKEKMKGPRPKMKGKLHWVDKTGKTCRSAECPGEGWQRGRVWKTP